MTYAPKHLFSQHLFSADLFGGDPMKLLAATASLYKRGPDGKLAFAEKLPVLQEEAGVLPLTDDELARIRSLYGPGAYEIVYGDAVSASKRRARFVISPSAAAPSVDPTPAPTLPAIFMEKVPLHRLFSMLLSEMEILSLASASARSVTDRWVASCPIAATPTVEQVEACSDTDWSAAAGHVWLRLRPTFLEMSDTDIYRAYVSEGVVVDRADLRDHLLLGISKMRVECERLAVENQMKIVTTRGQWYLWLDDERNPKTALAEDNGTEALGERYAQYQRDELTMVPWRWARSVEQAIWMVEEFGVPRTMSLDHDLGGDSTSMQFVRWLADEGHQVPKTYVHSANPVGRENILSYLRSYMRAMGEMEEKTAAAELDEVDDDLDFAAEAAEAAQQAELAEELAAEETRQALAEETV